MKSLFSKVLVTGFFVLCLFSGCMIDFHVHEFSKKWTSDAKYHWHAATCEHSNQISDKAAHTWDSGIVTKEATEDAEGEKTYTCTVCKATKTESIAKLPHTHRYSMLWSSDTSYHWRAATCGHNVVLSKGEHEWDSGTVIKEATTESTGEKTYTCNVCKRKKKVSIPKIEHTHTYSSIWTSDNDHHWYASTCGHDVVSSKAAHTWNSGTVTKAATEEAEGEKTYTCTVCKKTKKEAISKLTHTHTYSTAWTSDNDNHWHAATCNHDVVSSKAAHTWNSGTVTKAATEEAEGEKTYTCTVCKKTKKEVIPNLTHTHTYSTTWTSDDDNHWHAATCNHDVVTSKAAHTWNSGTVTKEPTEAAEGEKTYTCTVCNKTKKEAISKLTHTHTYSSIWTSDNDHHWYASTCGHDVVSSKAAHTWNSGTVTKAATEEAEGEKTYTCTVCKKTKKEVIEKLSHTHTYSTAWTSDDNNHWHAATCNHDVVSSKAAHTWNSGTVTKEPTEVAEGEKTYTCTVCNKTKKEAIEKLTSGSSEVLFSVDFEAALDSNIFASSGLISKVIDKDPVFASWAQYGDALVDSHGKVYQLCTFDSVKKKVGVSSLEVTVNQTVATALTFEYKADLWTSNKFIVSVDGEEKLNTTDMKTKWIKKSVSIPAGNHKVTFSVKSTNGAVVTSGLENSVFLDNLTLASDVMEKVDIYPKGLQESYVGGNTIQFSAKALRSDGSEMEGKKVNWSATGGTITSDGLFTPGNTAGTYKVTASINGKTASNSTVKIHNANYKSESYTIGGTTYTGFKSSSGTVIANTNNVTFDTSEGGTPEKKTVTADGFFVLKGTVADGKYAVVKTSKTINGTDHFTMTVLKGDFNERIWLRFGPGEYSVLIYDADISFRNTGDSRYEGDLYGSWGSYYPKEYADTNRILTVTNTSQTSYETAMWTMPSYYCQSDSFIVSNVVNGILAELDSNASNGEKMRVMHDWLVQRSHYDYISCNHTDQRKKQDAISVIKYEMCVCEGYANTLIALYRNAGLTARFISSTSMNHGWLQTLYKNEWKLVDPTWDEGSSDQGGAAASQDSNTDKCPNSENYTYFLVGLNGVNGDHYSYTDDFSNYNYTARNAIADTDQYRLPGVY